MASIRWCRSGGSTHAGVACAPRKGYSSGLADAKDLYLELCEAAWTLWNQGNDSQAGVCEELVYAGTMSQ